jgi:N-acetylglucosamine malate deacetylase 1
VNVDILAVGAHPDDIELGIGGLIHKLTTQGRLVALLDLTQGEMGTRGTPGLRLQEGEEAARILGATARENAGLPDAGLANTTEQQRRIIPFIRKFRPRILLFPMAHDRHPDHHAAHALVRDANFFSGLARIDTGQAPYRAPQVFFYHPYFENVMPMLIADISEHFEAKMKAIKAHASQFYNPDSPEPETFITTKQFLTSIETRAAYWGSRINAHFGETLYADAPIPLSALQELE